MKVNIPKVKNTDTKDTDFIKSPVKLTISLLVSNQIGTIRKCMESLKPILDAVPSELIVVDTVGPENSDGSLDIAREYADQVVRFEWCDDFAAARNAGLSRAKGEWFLFVDDDEWFNDPTEIIEFFTSGEEKKYNFTQYAVRSYENEAMTIYSDSWVTRMARRTKETKFVHAVHEMLTPIYSPEKKFTSCYAHHVGYIFKSQEEKTKHFHRNVEPLLDELEKYPDDIRLIMQLVQEYQFHGDFETVIKYCRQGETANEDAKFDLMWNYVVTALVRALIMLGQQEEALSEAHRLMEHPRLNDLARVNLFYLMVNAAEHLKDYETALEYAKKYCQLADYFDAHPDRLMNQVMLTQGDILLESNRKNIHRAIFLNCKRLERFEELCKFVDHLSWDKEYMKDKMYCFLTLEAVDQTGNYDCLTGVLTKLLENGGIPPEFMSVIRQVCNNPDEKRRYHYRKSLVKTGSTEPEFLVWKAWCAQEDGEDVQAILQECLDHGIDCAVPRQDLLVVCLKARLDPSPFLAPLYLEDWVAAFQRLVQNTLDLQGLLTLADRGLFPVSREKFYLLAKMIYQRFLKDTHTPQDKLWNMTEAYVRYTLLYSREIYQEQLLTVEHRQNIPREVVFVLFLQKALESREQKSLQGTLDALKQSVEAYPPMKDFVNRLLDSIQEELDQAKEQQSEFTALGEQVKKEIYRLIAMGEKIRAGEVLEQLKALIPNDPELSVIAKKL